MLVEKEVIRPGTTWYIDQKTNLPRKLVVTPDLTKYWCNQGNAMIADRLTVPVPKEHDFNAHPMTPAEKLDNNAGWVKEYWLKGDRLFSTLDITDDEYAKKLPDTIRWTSPWINSFTDGKGKEWKNVISHLALTTRPRVVDQDPFGSIVAALSVATPDVFDGNGDHYHGTDVTKLENRCDGGFCLSNDGLLGVRKSDKQLAPRYPVAFSLLSGVALSDDDFTSKKNKKEPPKKGSDTKKKESGSRGGGDSGGVGSKKGGEDFTSDDTDNDDDEEFEEEEFGGKNGNADINDVSMEELLCDLLGALGIHLEHSGNKEMFKRELYNAAMTKIHELGKVQQDPNKPQGNRANPPGQPPNKGQPNPLMGNVQQEQQPMYMSLEEINKLPDPMKGVALSFYAENEKLRAELDANKKTTDSLRDAKLKEATATRTTRVSLLGRLSPRVKADLDAMLVMPSMSLSMGDGGAVVDPMNQTLAVLEKGLADMPRLLVTDHTAMSVQPQPRDEDEMTDERASAIADGLARQMGCTPQAKAS